MDGICCPLCLFGGMLEALRKALGDRIVRVVCGRAFWQK